MPGAARERKQEHAQPVAAGRPEPRETEAWSEGGAGYGQPLGADSGKAVTTQSSMALARASQVPCWP